MADNTSPVTETELEVRISEAIRRVFPALDDGRVRHQKTFSLKLGHKALKVNGTEIDHIGGRLDILLELDGKPLAILELKKPGEQLDDAVTKQGLSYARALDSDVIPPLVITSNGKECRFFKSWDGEEWRATTKDQATVQALFAQAGKVSVENIDKAVQHLLNTVPQAWVAALRRYTATEIALLSGDPSDLSKVVTDAFAIPRKVAVSIAYLLTTGRHKIALIGEPLSGKTNVLASLCRIPTLTSFCFLYANLATSSEGIFERIASSFTREFFRTFSREEVKTWIINQLQREALTRLVVLVDGLDSSDPAFYRQDLDALATSANNGVLDLIVAGHQDIVRTLATVSGTNQPTALGEKLYPLALQVLDDAEFHAAKDLLYELTGASLEPSADLVFELRYPRLLRLLASQPGLKQVEPKTDDPRPEEVAVLFSLPNPRWFQAFWQIFSTSEVRENFRRLAEALLADSKRRDDPGAILRMKSLGALRTKTVEDLLPPERRAWLISRGFLQFIYRSDGLRLFLPKIPELLVTAASHLISEGAAELLHSKGPKAAADFILTESEPLPYSGITCALAFLLALEAESDFAPDAIDLLLNSPPEFHKLDPDAVLGILQPDGTVFKFSLSQLNVSEEDQSTGTWSNLNPWLALSYIMSQPMEGSGVKDLRLTTITTVGSCKTPVLGMLQSPAFSHGPIQTHELPGGITLLHGASAFLEPILQVIHIGFHDHPAEMRGLCKRAIGDGNIPLMHRLRMAAFTLGGEEECKFADELAPLLDAGIRAALLTTLKAL